MTDQLYTIKPLRWRRIDGCYIAKAEPDDVMYEVFRDGGIWWMESEILVERDHPFCRAAKAAAEKEHRRRMEKGLRKVKK